MFYIEHIEQYFIFRALQKLRLCLERYHKNIVL